MSDVSKTHVRWIYRPEKLQVKVCFVKIGVKDSVGDLD